MNRDLKEKGLRQTSYHLSFEPFYEPRPEREGIKTLDRVKAVPRLDYEPRPEREGIKTRQAELVKRAPVYEPRPEREGIKTETT